MSNLEEVDIQKKLKLSLNERLRNKSSPEGDQYLAEGFVSVEITIHELADGLVTLTFRSLNSFMRPFVQMPRGFYHLVTSAFALDYKIR